MGGHTLVANKRFTMRGREYAPGDPVDVSDLPRRKVEQLLNQRYFRPSPDSPGFPATAGSGMGTVNDIDISS